MIRNGKCNIKQMCTVQSFAIRCEYMHVLISNLHVPFNNIISDPL